MATLSDDNASTIGKSIKEMLSALLRVLLRSLANKWQQRAERNFKKLERNSAIDIGIFCNEEANLEKDNKDKLFFNKIITYGFIFRTIFFITGMIGCLGVIIFLSIITGHMSLK